MNKKFNERSRNYLEMDKDNKTCCRNPEINSKDGNRVCVNCGTVIERDLVSYERRAYTIDEFNKRRRTEKKWRDVGPRTVIGKDRRDSKGNLMGAKGKILYKRLDKIQNSLISSLERNYWEAKPNLVALCSKLNIPQHIKETAWNIYVECAKLKLTMGRTIIGFITASLYAAIRIHELPRILDEVCDSELVSRRTVHRALGMIIKEVFPILGLKYKPITSLHLVYRFGNDLNLPMPVQKSAVSMLFRAKKNGLSSNGKDPRDLAASAIYIAAKSSADMSDRRTQAEIAGIAKITEVTLRSRIKDIVKYID